MKWRTYIEETASWTVIVECEESTETVIVHAHEGTPIADIDDAAWDVLRVHDQAPIQTLSIE